MAFKPILFNTDMVRAILEGHKTQTRRIIKGIEHLNVYRAEPADETLAQWDFYYGGRLADGGLFDAVERINAPYVAGDVLWVREKFAQRVFHNHRGNMPFFAVYEAPEEAGGTMTVNKVYGSENETVPWTPSIHMPKDIARIFLRAKSVRVARLHDMDEDAAIAEGFPDSPAGTESPLERFSVSWDKTISRNALRLFGYHANPWVWVIEFERIERPEGWDEECRK